MNGLKQNLDRKRTVIEDTYLEFINNARAAEVIGVSEIIDLMKMMQQYEMDCHVVITGQNGLGKSIVLLATLKEYLGAKWFDNLILARNTTDDIVQFILHNNNTICGIDEWNQYLNYAQHADSDQKHFITTLELARSKSLGFIGCARDPRKLTLNYRDGKMSVVIWTMDRFVDGGSYAAVFVTNPVVESYDKFGFEMIPGDIVDFDELRYTFENLPSFVCYLNMDNAAKHLTKKELAHYKKEKDIAMAHAHMNHLVGKYKKKKIDYDELVEELDKLRDLIPEDVINKAIPTKQTKMRRYM